MSAWPEMTTHHMHRNELPTPTICLIKTKLNPTTRIVIFFNKITHMASWSIPIAPNRPCAVIPSLVSHEQKYFLPDIHYLDCILYLLHKPGSHWTSAHVQPTTEHIAQRLLQLASTKNSLSSERIYWIWMVLRSHIPAAPKTQSNWSWLHVTYRASLSSPSFQISWRVVFKILVLWMYRQCNLKINISHNENWHWLE